MVAHESRQSTCQGTFCAAQVRMAGHTQSLCRLALLCNLILSSRAPTLQIFMSIVTQCLLNRNILGLLQGVHLRIFLFCTRRWRRGREKTGNLQNTVNGYDVLLRNTQTELPTLAGIPHLTTQPKVTQTPRDWFSSPELVFLHAAFNFSTSWVVTWLPLSTG